jgi:hypothetical protein
MAMLLPLLLPQLLELLLVLASLVGLQLKLGES